MYVEGLFDEKKILLLLVCFPLQKKLGRSSYDVAMIDYDVILILCLLEL